MKTFLRLLETMERKRPVGTLVLGPRGRSCDLFIEEDRVYYACREYSGRVDIEGITQQPLAKRVARSTLDAAISGTHLVQKPLPESLFERGAISAEERQALMLRHFREEIFAQAFQYGESFSFQEGQVPELLLGDDPGKPPLPLKELLEVTRDRVAAVEEIHALIPSRKEVFVLTEKGMAHQHAAMSDYGLSRIFDLIDGFRDLNEIIRDVVFFDFYVLRTIATALSRGHLKKTILPEVRDIDVSSLQFTEATRYLPAFKAAVKHAADELGARERLASLHECMNSPEDAVIQYNFIGDAHYRMKKYQKALKAFQRALDLRPEDPLISEKVIRIYQEAAEAALRDGKRAAAIGFLKAARKIRPDLMEIWERLLELHIEGGELQEASEICDGVVARSRATRDIEGALGILRTTIKSFPEEPLFRKKLINIFLDFRMSAEAIVELEELAQIELKDGQKARVQEVLEKILKIDPERDDIRRQLKKLTRPPSTFRLPALKLSAVPVVVLVLLVIGAYQIWSYLELRPFREAALAHGEGKPPPKGAGADHDREERLLTLAAGAERFLDRFPLSVFSYEASQLAQTYRRELTSVSRERDRRKEGAFQQAHLLAQKGQQDRAMALLRKFLASPEGDPWRTRAEDEIAQIENYERKADDLKRAAEEAAAAKKWDVAYRSIRQILDEHRLSRAASVVQLPVLVRSVPAKAAVKVNGAPAGVTPCRLRITPGKSVKVELSAGGHYPAVELIKEDSGPEELIVLGRRPAWKAALGEPLKFPPILSQDRILIVYQNGTLSVLALSNGAEVWSAPGRGVVSPVAPPIPAAGRIFLPFNDGEIRRFSLSGTLELRLKPSGLISTPLQAWGDTLLFGTSNGSVMRWDLNENRALWSFNLRSPPFRLATAGSNRLLAATDKGTLLLVEHPGGSTVWEAPLREKIVSGPFVMGNLVVVRCSDNQVVVLDGRTGKVLSRRTLLAPFQAVPLTDRQRILLLENNASGNSEVVEIDPAASVPRRRVPLPKPVTSLFDIAGVVGAATPSGALIAMDATTYQPLWAYHPASGNVVACTADGRGTVVATDTGEVAWLPADKP